MSALKRLQDAASLQDVAQLLGFKARAVGYLIRGQPEGTRYTQFPIPKKSGGKRIISAPNAKLKLLQGRLAEYLQLCAHEIDATRGLKRSVSHGFKPNHSILTNADIHRRRRFVLNIDLNDFFGTIHFGRVRGFLMKSNAFALKPAAATVVAQIACHQGVLPQGSPCSPILSNLVANILDVRLAKLAKEHGCSYTRYADDLTFSTSMRDFPEGMATLVQGSPHVWEPGENLIRAIETSGFKINPTKTRLQHRRSRQDVTGIVVNNRLNVRAEYRRTVRAMVHRLRKTGAFDLGTTELTASGETSAVTKPGTMCQLQGRLNFIRSVDYASHQILPEGLLPSELMLKDFLYFKEFFAAASPVIMFEGKTDGIYLKEALRNLATSYPILATNGSAGFKVNLKLFKTSQTSDRLFGLSGGSGDFKAFLLAYNREYKKVSATKGGQPVVLLIDNDSGATDILKCVKNVFSASPVAGQHHFHVVDNLYILLTTPPGTTSCVEDLFQSVTRAEKIGGKTLHLDSKTFNSAAHYGKTWFAEKVVQQKQATIDFSGFIPLLSDLTSLVVKHAKPPAPIVPIPPASSGMPPLAAAPVAVPALPAV